MIILTKQEFTRHLETRCLSLASIDAPSRSYFAIILYTTIYAVTSLELKKRKSSFIRMEKFLLARGVKVSVESEN